VISRSSWRPARILPLAVVASWPMYSPSTKKNARIPGAVVPTGLPMSTRSRWSTL
jgi:hypothetical protein